MSSESAMHQRNLESSILFMQQEHASILKGLHEEIALLQKRCTDLTFQLTMNGLTIDEPGTIDTQMQQVQQELESSRTKIQTLEKELSERDKRVERLEAEARTQRKRWLDESRAQSQTMNSLRAELEAKANNIAYLTTELHRLKQKGKAEQANDPSDNGKGTGYSANVQMGHSMGQGAMSQPGYLHRDSTLSAKNSLHPHHHMPTPPSKEKTLDPASASSRIRRSGHNRSVLSGGVSGKSLAPSHPSSADALLGRQHNPLRMSSGRSSGSESPDITPFLPPPKEEIVQVVGVKQAPILPPIPASSTSAVNVGSLSHPVLVHQVVSSTSQHRQKAKPSKTEASIVTLAVENAAVPEAARTVAHESRSSEFN
ncbi:coiled-coil domain-containing protein 92 [Aplysia californica]|uniref:Coiled-coil domain-containing protein 92 n=1 Tax=Aplysia californica TaxID=6500 RepID=A0ABM0JSE8_APLCA|nr:coiled-coil domain-containing protein 92 [Aplysia californica]